MPSCVAKTQTRPVRDASTGASGRAGSTGASGGAPGRDASSRIGEAGRDTAA
jgi:hypothetical protein